MSSSQGTVQNQRPWCLCFPASGACSPAAGRGTEADSHQLRVSPSFGPSRIFLKFINSNNSTEWCHHYVHIYLLSVLFQAKWFLNHCFTFKDSNKCLQWERKKELFSKHFLLRWIISTQCKSTKCELVFPLMISSQCGPGLPWAVWAAEGSPWGSAAPDDWGESLLE